MKQIKNPFDWYPRDFWCWPEHDEKLLQVIHQVHDLDQVLPLIPNKRVCIQAGGACGVWPVYLSKIFDRCLAFEACYENYICSIFNDVNESCSMIHAAVGDKNTWERLTETDMFYEQGNSGAHYIGHSDGIACGDEPEVMVVAIDSIYLSVCDFICLDIEGFEYKALLGAKETIERCNPVIMIEEKPLPHLKPGEHLKAREYLESIGYKEVLKVNRDVVFIR